MEHCIGFGLDWATSRIYLGNWVNRLGLYTRQDLVILASRTLMIERFFSYFVVGDVFA
jgi:hypothetical protein